MRRTMHILLYILAAAAAAFLIFLITAAITDYRPAEKETLRDLSGLSTGTSAEVLPDSLSILCWNIGYGGLGDDMDFFYDGGTQVRTSRERTRANIDGIISEIRRHSPDVILLQEVDECSRRTYRINEVEMLRGAFPDYHIFQHVQSQAVPAHSHIPSCGRQQHSHRKHSQHCIRHRQHAHCGDRIPRGDDRQAPF